MHISFFITIHTNTFKLLNLGCGFEVLITKQYIVVSYNDLYCDSVVIYLE